MPKRSPFTALCRQIFAVNHQGRADLHVHSNHSDGLFSPEEVVARAKRAGLSAVAITDHDTLGGYCAAKQLAPSINVIPGVEITTEYQGRELHLLGYFIRADDPNLARGLATLHLRRSERFEAMAWRLRRDGLSIDGVAVRSLLDSGATLGRRHMAQLLVNSRQADNLFDAFSRFLCRPEMLKLPKYRLPIAEAINMVRAAGGVSSWAHPPADATIEYVRELQALGLNAVESEYPWAKPSCGRALREIAAILGLAITGGSDCHGPQPNSRAIGVKGISNARLQELRLLCLNGVA
jgi:3',5'-nucleoside bisphosphate phosphatase